MKSPNPSAPPVFANEAVANPAQTARPGRQYSLYCAPCLRGPPKSATGKGFGERIRRGRLGRAAQTPSVTDCMKVAVGSAL